MFCCRFCCLWLVSSVFQLVSAASPCDTANLTCKCETQSLAMMKKYLRWKAEWLCGIPHGSINWALVPARPSKIGKDPAYPACWCVFYFVFELFLSCSKLQWCVVEFQELWWDRQPWWQPMKATTLKQTLWTWMVRLPDSLCKHQQESELLWHLFCDAVTLCFRCAASDRRDCTIPVCALCEARTKWIQSDIGIHRDMQRSCLLDHSVCVFPWPCVLWCCVCRRQQHR